MLKINIKQFGIDIRNFTKGERIGKGGYSEVFLAQYKKTGENYAAKVLSNNVFKEDEKSKIENEIDIMTNTKHPTIIKYYGYSLQDFDSLSNIVIFTEYAKNGSLSRIIAKAKKSKLPADYDNTARQIILIGVSCGMKYLHHQNIMHRDLNTNNILLDDNYYPHITDFGMAKYLHKTDLYKETPIIGTLPYMAPEMILGNKYSSKIDVYSFGILMYEVLCESDLYPILINKETFSTDNSITNEYREHIAVSNNRPEFNKDIKNSLKELIQICWSSNAKERPNFDQIYDKLTNPEYYLENVDVSKIKKYIDFLSKSENVTTKDSELIEKVNMLSKENYDLKNQIKSLKENNEKLTNKCAQLKQLLDEATKKIEKDSISIQPPNPKENLMLNSPRFHHQREKKENNESLLVKINNDKQKLFKINDDRQNSIKNDEKTNKIVKINDEKQLKQRLILKEDRQLPANLIIINDEKQLKQQLMKINDEKQQLATTPQKSMKCDMKNNTPIKSPVIIVQQKDANDSEIVNIHQKEKKKNDEVEISQKPPLLFTPIKDKINGQLLVPSTTPRRLPQFSNRDDDNRSLTPQKVKNCEDNKLPQLHKFKKIENISEISVSDFNSYTIQQQQQFINNKANLINSSLLFLKRKSNQYIINLQNFLNYLIQYVTSPDTSNYIQIQLENQDEKFDNLTDSNQLNILSKTTEILYGRQQLDSQDFYQLTKLFKRISIEIQYFSKIYRIAYKIIFPINHLKINIFVSGIKKTDNTFKGNKYIKSVRFDETVENISDFAFENCIAMKTVFFSSTINSIGAGSFEGCYLLKSLSIPPSVNSIGFSAFKGCSDLVDISISNSIKLIRNNTFYGCKNLVKFTVPSSVSSIGDYAFYQCSSLSEISIPSSVISIGEFAFAECSGIKSIYIPCSVNSIGKSAFKGCSALEQIKIPSSIHGLKKLDIIDECKILKI